ncbi:MAG: hypothetical protein NZM17_02370 [Pyrinomonadaceae bacterium]|nr:hypothetical protein [Pyrinomonadaceae bacterium]
MTKQQKSLLPPIGAGDLIDRSIRLYRQHILTLILIAIPPVLFCTLLSTGWNFFVYSNLSSRIEVDFLALFGNTIFWLAELIMILCVMGGFSRNLVSSIVFETPISFRETYLIVVKKIGKLFVSSALVATFLLVVFFITFYFSLVVFFLLVGVLLYITSPLFYLSMISVFLSLIVVFLGGGWIFFFVASRFVYVPQVIAVEGKGVLSAISRSSSLARANTNRVYALFVFTIIVVYVALALIYIPLLIYSYFSGVENFIFKTMDRSPLWYLIISEGLFQISLVLASPVLMIGLSLLYIDERVRNEGYDIELLAARHLEEVPLLETQSTPFHPVLKNEISEQSVKIFNIS